MAGTRLIAEAGLDAGTERTTENADAALTVETVLTGESRLGSEALLVIDVGTVIPPVSRSIDDGSTLSLTANAALRLNAPAATAAVAPAAVTVCQRQKDAIVGS